MKTNPLKNINKKAQNYPILKFIMEVNSLVCEYLFLNNKKSNTPSQPEITGLASQITEIEKELQELFHTRL